MDNYTHHEGIGFHLTVNADGVVSLWDDAVTAQSITGEVYLFLDLTPTQAARLERAEEKAERLEQE